MKTKKIMSQAALAALMVEVPDTEAITDETEATAAELDVEAKVDDTQDEKVEVEVDAEAGVNEELEAYKLDMAAVLQEATDKEEALAAKVEELTAQLTASETSAQALKEIVTSQVSKMRIALKFAATDMKDFSAEAIVTEYQNTVEAFMKALPVGSVVPAAKAETPKKAVESSHDLGKVQALGFK